MPERIFGLESEYSVALRKKEDRWFYTEADCIPPATLMRKIFPLPDDAPEYLKKLLFFPKQEQGELFWLGANGARFYFDIQSSLPEYATPECTAPRQAIAHSVAGDRVVEALRQEVLRQKLLESEFGSEYYDIHVFKMSAAFRENVYNLSVGFHENYMTLNEFMPTISLACRFGEFCDFFVPFLISRQIFDGSGGILKEKGEPWKYVISQRVFFINMAWSDHTTGSQAGRGFFNFRSTADECLPGKTRLHVLSGDHFMSPKGKYIAMAATHLVLRAIEEVGRDRWKYGLDKGHFKSDGEAIACDPTLRTPLRVKRGQREKKFLPCDMQKEYADFVAKHVKNLSGAEEVLFRDWTAMIEKLGRAPQDAAGEIDWLIKQNYLNERCGGDFGSKKARFASAFYHDISSRGLYNTLVAGGAVEPFFEEGEIENALALPPATRAEFRSRYIKLALQDPVPERLTIGNWGTFSGIGGTMYFADPLAVSTKEGDELLATFQKWIDMKKIERS